MVSSLFLMITCTACKTMDTIVLPSGERVLRSSLDTMAMMSDELGLVKPGLGASGKGDAGGADGVVVWVLASGIPFDLKLIVAIVELGVVYYGSNWILTGVRCKDVLRVELVLLLLFMGWRELLEQGGVSGRYVSAALLCRVIG